MGNITSQGRGEWLLEDDTPSSSSVLEKSKLISSIPIKRHNKRSHRAYLLLLSSAFHGKMPNANKTSSCGPPQSMGLIQWLDCRRVVFHGSDAGAAVVRRGCSFQQVWKHHQSAWNLGHLLVHLPSRLPRCRDVYRYCQHNRPNQKLGIFHLCVALELVLKPWLARSCRSSLARFCSRSWVVLTNLCEKNAK